MSRTILDNKYRTVKVLGEGGFGEVWLAEDSLIDGRLVAIKVLKNINIDDVSPLIEEIQYLSSFDHQNIVKFLHHFYENERLHIVMEYCSGGSLADFSRGKIGTVQVFSWGKILTDTFREIHGKGIVHHDIKPQNLLSTKDGKVRVADFGIANRNWGTPIYMAPELSLAGRVAENDERIDIYALGISLLELLIGENPLLEYSGEDLLQAKIDHNFIPHELDRWVQEILLKATHPTPEQRFQTMEDFGNAIGARKVSFIFDGNQIKAQNIAESAQKLLTRKKWKTAEKRCQKALHIAPDCVTALMTAGRIELMLKRTQIAKEYYSRALKVNPRVRVQKELGWIALEEGYYPRAISMLTDHLQRESTDFEAYNLLLRCFYETERFEIGEQLADSIIAQGATNNCFINNRFLFRLLEKDVPDDDLDDNDKDKISNPFAKFNFEIATENPSSWNIRGKPPLKSKLLFQDYRFGDTRISKKKDGVCLKFDDESRASLQMSLITIGRLDSNYIQSDQSGTSRRHAVILNFPDDVWIYDLASVTGTMVDGRAIRSKVFLDGVHRIQVGTKNIELAIKESLLI